MACPRIDLPGLVWTCPRQSWSDRLSSEKISSYDNLRFVDPAHKSHFLNNSVTNHRSSIPVFLRAEMIRTSSSERKEGTEPTRVGEGPRGGRQRTALEYLGPDHKGSALLRWTQYSGTRVA